MDSKRGRGSQVPSPAGPLSIQEPLLLNKGGAQWVLAAPLGTRKKQRNPSAIHRDKAAPGVPQTNPRGSGTKSKLNLKPLPLHAAGRENQVTEQTCCFCKTVIFILNGDNVH